MSKLGGSPSRRLSLPFWRKKKPKPRESEKRQSEPGRRHLLEEPTLLTTKRQIHEKKLTIFSRLDDFGDDTLAEEMMRTIFSDLKDARSGTVDGRVLEAVGFALMDKLDDNHDGHLSEKEFVSHMVEHVTHGDPERRKVLVREVIELVIKVHQRKFKEELEAERLREDALERELAAHREEQTALGLDELKFELERLKEEEALHELQHDSTVRLKVELRRARAEIDRVTADLARVRKGEKPAEAAPNWIAVLTCMNCGGDHADHHVDRPAEK